MSSGTARRPSLSTSTSNDMITEEPHGVPRLSRRLTGFLPQEIKSIDTMIPLQSREIWKKHAVQKFETPDEFQSKFIQHVETTLARSLYNCDDLAAYQATSQSVRDNLVIDWNKSQQRQTARGSKRVYYLSLEFLMGRALDNALINLQDGTEEPGAQKRDQIKSAIDQLGFNLEDVLEQEPDAALGNGGLGRLAACFIDSMATGDYPAWGYGLRYKYGIFAQKIIDGYQVETPDYWLNFTNPWEIERSEIQVPINFYGYVDRSNGNNGDGSTLSPSEWIGGERVIAVPYDMPIPGFKTENVNNLRLWSARPTTEFDFAKFNSGDYKNSVEQQQRAESITSVLYPNDNFQEGKELRLKQQYFWCAASLHDIVRRFKKGKHPWEEFPDLVAIQLNDTHPTLAIVELQRILVDLEHLDWHKAWDIVTKTFAYTNHTVMQEALEKWPIGLFGHLLPRHLEIIYDINWFFLKAVEKKFPRDVDLLGRVSIIEESSGERQIRMAFLAIVGSHKVNGVAELHSELIKTTIFQDFVKVYGLGKFTNVTNGITPRRWLKQANPDLAALISKTINDPQDDYLLNMSKLTELAKYAEDTKFQTEWNTVKQHNKQKLADLIKKLYDGEDIIERDHIRNTLFDIQVKRIHEYKRQQLNIFGCIYRYLRIKELLAEGVPIAEVEKKYPRKVSIFGGKSAPGYYMAKTIIKLINSVSDVVNHDKEIGNIFKVVFIPDYNVSKAEIIIPASDLSEHISTAGTEASGTSNMKFVMNGGLIIGTVDGANVEITREIGEDNIFLFGNLAENVDELRYQHQYHAKPLPKELEEVLQLIERGTFDGDFKPLVDSIRHHGDYYLVSDDFQSYLQMQSMVDDVYHNNKKEWLKKSILSVANVGFFSSDRCIQEYADEIWNVEPLTAN
ncbi:glycogen phosphorylase [Kluyveromyces marxianus]|uniref:Alpha-1,4 glucan phosphorylase n=2 Tax=Kluyveromyces marxianus TaxID=4911 RepID=W0T9E2_KLUMD|nr:glycogen phosphorylase [Kluyveromyces marxianus DMKU3-1042]QGN14453.1 glycogen phosphorylase [Kluyveromyces marxianus]BAO38714.1 glycogen phosphorylase [Kluyveromyces marxianus DMKU3-1042]BAP70259.1 glycogen phosphorylase [Kluyveromyces marxianus]